MHRWFVSPTEQWSYSSSSAMYSPFWYLNLLSWWSLFLLARWFSLYATKKKKRYIRTLSFNLPLFILPFTNTPQSTFIISLKIKVSGPCKKGIKNAGDFLIVRYASLISSSLSTHHRAHTISVRTKTAKVVTSSFTRSSSYNIDPFKTKCSTLKIKIALICCTTLKILYNIQIF